MMIAGSLISADASARPHAHSHTHITTSTRRAGSMGLMNRDTHRICGFVENFSKSHYFCRYCDIERATFQNSPLLCGNTRTEQSYQNHLQELGTSGRNSECGIKSVSPFNQLFFFHFCQPGLPHVLGMTCLKALFRVTLLCLLVIKSKKLNRCIHQFKYQRNDAHDKPADVSPGSNKLTGHAAQNWCSLHLLPLLMGELVLQLREIVELICAPAITRSCRFS